MICCYCVLFRCDAVCVLLKLVVWLGLTGLGGLRLTMSFDMIGLPFFYCL